MRSATTIVAFQDLQEGVLRNPGDVFQVEDERAAYLEGLGFVRLDPVDPKPAKRKTTAKK